MSSTILTLRKRDFTVQYYQPRVTVVTNLAEQAKDADYWKNPQYLITFFFLGGILQVKWSHIPPHSTWDTSCRRTRTPMELEDLYPSQW